jgi:alpha-beta hydrolase superfamily lysophospholipase
VAKSVELTVDITGTPGVEGPAHTAVTVHLPDDPVAATPPVVCFAFPGAGYGRHYYSFDMPGSTGGGQAGWHTSRGWIFVACDHLGVGDSTVPDGPPLPYEPLAAANRATVDAVVAKLAEGMVADGFPAVQDPVKLGLGQSFGGGLLTVMQGQFGLFDGIGVLGSSAIHTIVPSPPGTPPAPMPWITRGSDLAAPVVVNQSALAAATAPVLADHESMQEAGATGTHPFAWAFHYDDEPAEIVAEDMAAMAGGAVPPWRSATIPASAILMVSPGTFAPEAAAIDVPILLATGERDVVPDPWLEPKAYKSASDITVFVCPRMAHMHNFASTRELFWARIHAWGDGVRALASLH